MADQKSRNPWHGCRKYSEGCQHCYMYVLDRAHKVPEQSGVIARTQMFDKPLQRDRHGRFKVPAGFVLRVNMTSDTFIEDALYINISNNKDFQALSHLNEATKKR